VVDLDEDYLTGASCKKLQALALVHKGPESYRVEQSIAEATVVIDLL
jgi:hypothetical protein